MFSHFFTLRFKPINKQSQAGFGVIELIISISIIVIVSSIILVRQTSFNGAVLLRSQAYEVALQIRDVQLSAVSASYDGATYRSVVGLHFDDDSSNNTSYTIFSDVDGNGFFSALQDSEFGIQGILDSRFEIREVRVGGAPVGIGGLSIVFMRPNFDAEFSDSSGPLAVTAIELDVARKGATGTGLGDVRTIEVTSTGQISVN